MSKRKIIFIDVDGTLVNYELVLPESAITAIRRARENGHKVYKYAPDDLRPKSMTIFGISDWME